MSLYRYVSHPTGLSRIRFLHHQSSPLRHSVPSLYGPAHLISPRVRLAQGSFGRRAFSIAPLFESSVRTTIHFIAELHAATGTPWFVTIPLVALTINVLARLPLTIYARTITQGRARLTPLLQAWNTRHLKDVDSASLPPSAKRKEVTARYLKTTKRLYRESGLQQWKLQGSFLVFPVWLSAIEAIRRMCGGPRGLLGTLIFGPEGNNEDVVTATAGPSASIPADIASPDAVVPIDETILSAGSGHFPAGADPSLATGGCLWFPDLLVPDPLHILPVLLSAVLFISMLPKSRPGRLAIFSRPSGSGDGNRASAVVQSTAMTGLQRGLLIVALMVGPLTMDLPSALHLYWLSSAAMSHIQTEAVHRFMPMPKSKVRMCAGNESTFIRPPPPKS